MDKSCRHRLVLDSSRWTGVVSLDYFFSHGILRAHCPVDFRNHNRANAGVIRKLYGSFAEGACRKDKRLFAFGDRDAEYSLDIWGPNSPDHVLTLN